MFTELKNIKQALIALEDSSIISIMNASGVLTYANEHFCEHSKYISMNATRLVNLYPFDLI